MNKQEPKINFYQSRDFGQVFTGGFTFLRHHFKPLFLLLISIGGPFLLVGVGSYSFVLLRMESLINTSGSDWVQALTSSIVNILSFGVGWVMITSVINGYIKLYIQSPDSQPVIQLGTMWQQVRKDFWWLLWRSILFYLLLVVVFGGLVGLYVLFAYDAGYKFQMGFGILYFLGVFVLMCYLSPYMGLFLTQGYFERTGFFTSISRTFYLIRDNWWLTFGLGVVTTIVMYIIFFIIYIPFVLIMTVTTLMQTSQNEVSRVGPPDMSSMLVTVVLTMFAMMIGYLLMLSIHYVMAAVHYHSLVEQKEGVGLLNRIGSIGEQQEGNKAAADFYDEEEKY